MAKFYMFQAENAYWKGYELRRKKVAPEIRLKEYTIACDNFLKAYKSDPSIFTLFRIETALESCIRTHHQEGREIFELFRDEYIKQHPTEAEYGDAMPSLDM
ncbi:MAG: hypothetical protein HYZ84_07310 [Candidatus Omnitrophica bacterium]|nr:hypothetical protein [Candidatus Omnitrophota bacterium]